jgi:uncharacterized protein
MTEKNFQDNLFDNLKDLGFENLEKISLYVNREATVQNTVKLVNNSTPADFLYDRKVICPVCNKDIKIKSVKTSGIRIISRDTDFMTLYGEPNPIFYDAWMCVSCGYTALSSRFNTINSKQITQVKQGITSKWKFNKIYSPVYTVENAIEMHQMALLNAVTIQAKDSEKAMICLKLSWLYRIKKDEQNEKKFQYHAQLGFVKALEYERFPIFGLDETSLEYLVGELYRRLGDNSNALLWFSRVLGSRQAKSRIKDMARNQKEAIHNLQAK